MTWQQAVCERFAGGAEMVVVFPAPDGEPGDLIARGIILNGLRKATGKRNLREAADAYGNHLDAFLVLSAIDGIQDGPTEREGR